MDLKTRGLTKNSLLFKIFISYILSFLIFFLSFYTYYYTSNKLLSERINASMFFSLLQVKNSLSNYINELTKTETMLSLNSDILECINKDYSYIQYNHYLIDYLKVRKQIDLSKASLLLSECNVIVTGMNGNIFSTYSDSELKADIFNDQSFLIRKIKESNGSFYFSKYKKSDLFNSEAYIPFHKKNTSDSILVIGKLVKRGLTPLGCIMITIEEDYFYKAIKDTQLPDGNIILLADSDGDITYSSDASIYNFQFINDELKQHISKGNEDSLTFNLRDKKFIAGYTTIETIGWKIIYAIPYDVLFKDINRLKTILLMFAAIISIITLLGLFFILKNFFLPIRSLNELMKKVQQGNLDVKFSMKTNDELNELYDNFNIMVNRIKDSIHTIKANQLILLNKQKTEDELKYRILQSQINPHFLFNTLNNIKWIASINQIPVIVDMIAALGNLLEISTNKIEDKISISKEISYLRDYILLQKVRYGDKFDIEINVDKDIQDYKIMKLILQPIVENAIIHGLISKPGKGSIRIVGYRLVDDIMFEIIDDGCGIDTQKIHELQNSLESDNEKFNSIGIHNIDKRLKLIYGEKYGINIESKVGQGTKVSVLLPILTDLLEA